MGKRENETKRGGKRGYDQTDRDRESRVETCTAQETRQRPKLSRRIVRSTEREQRPPPHRQRGRKAYTARPPMAEKVVFASLAVTFCSSSSSITCV